MEQDRRSKRRENSNNEINTGSVGNRADLKRSAPPAGRRKSRSRRKPEKMRIEMRQAPKRRRRRPSSSRTNAVFEILYKFLLIAAILCAVLFMFTVFFEIKDIEVEGNEKYSTTEITAATGIEEGDKLLFINKFDAESKVYEKLAYIDNIKIKQRPPSKLIIEVTESKASVCLQNGGMTYLIDDKCKLLEFYPTDNSLITLPIIKCSEIADPVAGKEIAFVESYMLQALKDVMSYILDDEIARKVTDLSIEKLYDINFMYENRLKVVIGEPTDIEKKILYFKTVVNDIGDDEKGTVNVKNPERTIFRPSTAGGEK